MADFVQRFLACLPSMSARYSTRIYIDDFVCRLHYLITAKALYFASVFSVVLLMFDWVQCYTHNETIPPKIANVYCWMQNTFVLPNRVGGIIGEDVPHQGVDNALQEDERVYISYYQWLPLFLLFQGCCFELGHFLWKSHEHMEINNMTIGFQYPIAKKIPENAIMSDGDIERNLSLVASCIKKSWSKKPWSYRPWVFLECILLNTANSVLQIYLLHRFFKLDKLSTDWRSFNYLSDNYFLRTDELVSVFPRMVKCIFYQFGAGGSVQTHDIMCLLPFNIYSEKFFALCLVWYYVLTVLTALSLIIWMVILLLSPLRKLLANFPVIHMFPQNDAVLEFVRRENLNAGNWFLMWLLCKNIHTNHLEKLLPKLKEGDDAINEISAEKWVGNKNKIMFEEASQTLLKSDKLKKRHSAETHSGV